MDNRDRNVNKTKKHWQWCYDGKPPCLGSELRRCMNCTPFQCRTCRHRLEKKKRTEHWQEHVRQHNESIKKKLLATWRTWFTVGGCHQSKQVRPSSSRTWSKKSQKNKLISPKNVPPTTHVHLQNLHWSKDVKKLLSPYRPASHFLQAERPVLSPYQPLGHGLQELEP